MKQVVTADWLTQHLHDPEIVIIDCRFSLADASLGRQKYLESHIPGAHYLDLTWIIHEESRKGKKESLKRNRIKLSNN